MFRDDPISPRSEATLIVVASMISRIIGTHRTNRLQSFVLAEAQHEWAVSEPSSIPVERTGPRLLMRMYFGLEMLRQGK
jgi:hypothetical protein